MEQAMALPKTVTINNQEFETALLSDAARMQLTNIQVAEIEMVRLQQKLAMIKTAHNAYKAALFKAMNEKVDEKNKN
jgi:hypothetical protein